MRNASDDGDNPICPIALHLGKGPDVVDPETDKVWWGGGGGGTCNVASEMRNTLRIERGNKNMMQMESKNRAEQTRHGEAEGDWESNKAQERERESERE